MTAIEAGKAVVRVEARSTLRVDLAKSLGRVKKFARSAKTAISGAFAGIQRIAGAGALVGGTGLAAGFGLAKMAGDLEKTKIVFKNLIGSGSASDQLVSDLNEMADTTPFDNDDLLKSAKILLVTGTAVGKVKDEMQTLMTLAAKGDSSVEDIAALLLDIRGKGKADSVDFKQFGRRAIDVRGKLQEQLGLSQEQLQKRISSPIGEGAITPQEFEAAVKAIASELGGLVVEQSRSFNGLLSTLIGKTKAAGKSMGQVLIDTLDLKGLMSGAIGFLSENKTRITSIFQEIVIQIKAAALTLRDVVVASKRFSNILSMLFKGDKSISGFNALLDVQQNYVKVLRQQAFAQKMYTDALAVNREAMAKARVEVARSREPGKMQRDPDLPLGIGSLGNLTARERESFAKPGDFVKVGETWAEEVERVLINDVARRENLAKIEELTKSRDNLVDAQASRGTFSSAAFKRFLSGSSGNQNPLLIQSKSQTKKLDAINAEIKKFVKKVGIA